MKYWAVIGLNHEILSCDWLKSWNTELWLVDTDLLSSLGTWSASTLATLAMVSSREETRVRGAPAAVTLYLSATPSRAVITCHWITLEILSSHWLILLNTEVSLVEITSTGFSSIEIGKPAICRKWCADGYWPELVETKYWGHSAPLQTPTDQSWSPSSHSRDWPDQSEDSIRMCQPIGRQH